jgi:hypothetical protein
LEQIVSRRGLTLQPSHLHLGTGEAGDTGGAESTTSSTADFAFTPETTAAADFTGASFNTSVRFNGVLGGGEISTTPDAVDLSLNPDVFDQSDKSMGSGVARLATSRSDWQASIPSFAMTTPSAANFKAFKAFSRASPRAVAAQAEDSLEAIAKQLQNNETRVLELFFKNIDKNFFCVKG